MEAWEKTSQAEAAFRGTAVKQCSALRAAMERAMLDETASRAGFACGSVFVDIAKFFENMDWLKLVERAAELGFSTRGWC